LAGHVLALSQASSLALLSEQAEKEGASPATATASDEEKKSGAMADLIQVYY
jgi:hypothetical protein